MRQSVLEIAKELSLALIETGNVPPEDMQDTLQRTHATLTALKAQEAAGTTIPVSDAPLVNWRKSITKYAITCLACGQTFKQLSRRHLQEHGLDGRSYRATYGIPRTQSLAAKTTTARRREIAQETRLWEKTPTFRKGHERVREEETAPEEARAASEAAKASAVAAPAPAKRARKTTRKKRSEG
jgi:predicted transcriptional regulator